jgi:hypothetical protein
VRAVVRASFEVEEYHPTPHDDWDEAYQKQLKLTQSSSSNEGR